MLPGDVQEVHVLDSRQIVNQNSDKKPHLETMSRIAAIRADGLHKLTTRLVQTYREIVIEDLHVKGMMQNRKLARAISDMGLGMFRRMLTYKAAPTKFESEYATSETHKSVALDAP